MQKYLLSFALITAVPCLQASVPASPAKSTRPTSAEAAYRQARTEPIPAEAARLLRVAADLGHADAQVDLALAYEHGDGVEKDQTLAFQWNQKAAEQGNPYGMRNVGVGYLYGRGARTDKAEGIKWLQAAAAKGNGSAMSSLGWAYEHGEGVKADPPTARQWYMRGADAGDMEASFQLGRFYAQALGGARNVDEAIKAYEFAANGGHAPAMFELARIYRDGEFRPRDLTKSLQWLVLSADKGERQAMTELGKVLLLGIGTRREPAAATRWLKKAAAEGSPLANYWLGRAAEEGWGQAIDDAGAAAYYRLASEAGIQDARNRLIVMHLLGRGVNKDAIKAEELIARSLASGNSAGLLDAGVLLFEASAEADSDKVFQRVLGESGETKPSAELCDTLLRVGKHFRGAGLAAKALPFLVKANEQLQLLPGASPLDFGQVQDELGLAYLDTAQPRAAEAALQRGYESRLQGAGPASMAVADSLASLAYLAYVADQFDLSAKRYREVLQIREKHLSQDDPILARHRATVAQMMYRMGKYKEAEDLFRRSLVALESKLGNDHPALGNTLNNMAWNYVAQQQYAEAEAMFRRVLAIRRMESGNKLDVGIAVQCNNLGSLLTRMKRYKEAGEMLSEARSIQERLLGPNHVELSFTWQHFGNLFAAQRENAKADEAFERAMALVRSHFGNDHTSMGDLLFDRGMLSRQRGELEQSRVFLSQALAIKLRKLPGHPATQVTGQELASVYRALDQEAAAREVESQILAVRRSPQPETMLD